MAKTQPANVASLRPEGVQSGPAAVPGAAVPIPFIDLQAQRRRLGRRIDDAMARVFEHGRFVAGPEIDILEESLSAWCGARYTVACASGTNALSLGLSALGGKYRDAVFVSAFTFVSPAEVIARLGCIPVFVDVKPDTFNMDPDSLQAAIKVAEREGLAPRGVIVIDLFGQPADYAQLRRIATAHDMWLMADAAQSFGATLGSRKVGTLTKVTTTSFFPSKPLGCYGDGGAIFTDSQELAAEVRSRRQHGMGEDRMTHVRIGMNGRLDTLQAAILLEKLDILADELSERDRIARRYNDGLGDVAITPTVARGRTSAWAQYTVRLEEGERDAIRDRLGAEGIPTAVYYHTALHHHAPYSGYPRATTELPVAEKLAQTVLSLPFHPYLEADTQDFIIERFRAAVAEIRGA